VPQTQALARGALTISIDLEILWGIWDKPISRRALRGAEFEREICARLLGLFRRYDAAVTWAIVGRLLDDSRGFDGLIGPRRFWYAPDVIELIQADRIKHEIGSHTFSHVDFGSTPREHLAEDLERARQVHRARGLAFDSFVFPRNHVGHLDLLKSAGLRVFRSTDEGLLRWAENHVPRARALLNIAEKALALPSPVVRPLHHENGLVELGSSMLLLGRSGPRRVVSPAAVRKKLVEGVRRAATEGAIFHLWFHPSNFYDEPETQFELLESCLSEAASLRSRGELDVRPMGDFAPQRASA
jgi:hypothetical protein